MGKLKPAALAAADAKKGKERELLFLNDAMHHIRRMPCGRSQEAVRRRLLTSCETIRKSVIDEINKLNTIVWKGQEALNESSDLRSRRADRHGHDDGKPLQCEKGG